VYHTPAGPPVKGRVFIKSVAMTLVKVAREKNILGGGGGGERMATEGGGRRRRLSSSLFKLVSLPTLLIFSVSLLSALNRRPRYGMRRED